MHYSLCCLSGILGGLVGAKGPIFIIYFLFFPADKAMVRIIGTLSSFAIALSRMITYAVTDPPIDNSWPTTKYLQNHNSTTYNFDSKSWFIKYDWGLYLAVVGVSIVGCVIGIYLHEKINQRVFNLILIGLLFLSSIVFIVKGILGGIIIENEFYGLLRY